MTTTTDRVQYAAETTTIPTGDAAATVRAAALTE
jgi:hypothetical protein